MHPLWWREWWTSPLRASWETLPSSAQQMWLAPPLALKEVMASPSAPRQVLVLAKSAQDRQLPTVRTPQQLQTQMRAPAALMLPLVPFQRELQRSVIRLVGAEKVRSQ